MAVDVLSNIIKIQPFEAWNIIVGDVNRKWQGVIFHHTAHSAQEDQGGYIDWLHKNGKRQDYPAFRNGMGYHFLVNKSGSVEVGIRWPRQIHGAHCRTDKQSWNFDYIGIALAGNLEHQRVTGRQLTALLSLLRNLNYGIGMPHSLLVPTLCPGRYFPYDDVYECINYMKLKEKYST